jgi:hypothetical protein
MWIDIFKAGSYKDEDGNPKVYTEQDLDAMVRDYNPTQHEAPVTIGPVTTESPAWAWVNTLKREGARLRAELKQAVPEFQDMVTKGLFTKRSISFTPFGGLRSVGFLGADPPNIPGLDAIKFSETDLRTVEFAESELLDGKPSDRLSVLIDRKMGEKPAMSYGEAFSEVQLQNPDLALAYIDELYDLT